MAPMTASAMAQELPASSSDLKTNSFAHMPAIGGMPASENMKTVMSTAGTGA